jgi:hypothetical protein
MINEFNELNENGYIHFKKIIITDKAMDSIRKDKVNYYEMTDFIENTILSTVQKVMKWENPVYIKYRVSDNNNSADASAFHRDIICQSRNSENIPIFTCLTYLDNTIMEVIPGSHTKLFMNFNDSIKSLGNRKKIYIEQGDILLFYSNLLHRGIFTENLTHRRLIQVFEIFPSTESFNKYKNQILHIKGNEQYSDFMIKLSRINITSNMMNIYGYFNSSMGYGIMPEFEQMGVTYLSSEGLRGRLIPVKNSWQDINKYIINSDLNDMPNHLEKKMRYICYNRQYINYTIISIILLCLIILVTILTYKIIYKPVKVVVRNTKRKKFFR